MSSTILLQKEKLLPIPAAGAAIGMAASYYTYPFLVSLKPGYYLVFALLLGLMLAVSLIRVLKFFPGEKNKALLKIGILTVAAAVGFSLGIAGRKNVNAAPDFGLQPDSIIAVSGILRSDPRTLHGGSGMGSLELSGTSAQGGLRASASGIITVFFPAWSIPGLAEFGRGSEIYVDGRLTQKETSYLFNASSVHIVKGAGALERLRTSLRMKLLEKFQSRQDGKYSDGAAPVWGPLASALLLGMRDDLDVDLAEGFRNSGCAHILVLSGMHLAVLSGLLAFLLRRPLGIRFATLAGALFVIVYVFIAGSQPSLVRSAIMYLIGAVSLWGFLKSRPFSLLCMAFIIQLIFQSETGMTLSFILSYLALAGILTLGATLRNLLRGRLPEIISGTFSASVGAFVFTAPVVVFYFGSLKPIGIITSILAGPLSALFMVLSLMALAASFLPLPLWTFFDFILTLVYRAFEFTVSVLGKVPGLSISNPAPVLVFSLLFWLAILFIQRRDYGRRNSIASFD